MRENVNFQIWFKVCRPLKIKYKLATNVIMVLNGIYVYSKVINKSFTRRNIITFASYYNSHKIDLYFKVLLDKGFIIQSGNKGSIIYYSISSSGINVINELNDNYRIVFNEFVSKYNISL